MSDGIANIVLGSKQMGLMNQARRESSSKSWPNTPIISCASFSCRRSNYILHNESIPKNAFERSQYLRAQLHISSRRCHRISTSPKQCIQHSNRKSCILFRLTSLLASRTFTGQEAMIDRIFMFMSRPPKNQVKKLVETVRGALKQCQADAKWTSCHKAVDCVVMYVQFASLPF
jgi:hypothetical protein